jgi:hypothetical protein
MVRIIACRSAVRTPDCPAEEGAFLTKKANRRNRPLTAAATEEQR